MNDFVVEHIGKIPKMKNPVVIEGLPGIGNVARIAADFLISKLKAKKIMNVYSKHFPNTVFINEQKLVDLPKIEIFHGKNKNQDFLVIIGDIQPAEEQASYLFSQALVDISHKLGAREIITIGGINSKVDITKPDVYCACTEKSYIPILKKAGVKFERKGTVIIVGAAGLMLGICKLKKMKGFVLLSETIASYNDLGLNAACSILEVIMKYLKLNFSLKDLNSEIKNIRRVSSKRKEMVRKKIMKHHHIPEILDLNYIG